MKADEEKAREYAYRHCGHAADEMSQRFNDLRHAYLAGLREGRGEWVSVKYRLPESGVPVLLYPNTVGVVGYGCIFDGKRWCDYEDHTEPFAPTHWMPLPDPPKEGVD